MTKVQNSNRKRFAHRESKVFQITQTNIAPESIGVFLTALINFFFASATESTRIDGASQATAEPNSAYFGLLP